MLMQISLSRLKRELNMEDKTKAISSPSNLAIHEPCCSQSSQPTESHIVSAIKIRLCQSLEEEEEPSLFLKSAGKESCCIFRIPDSFTEVIPKAYTPKAVSIGPLHYGEKHLQMIQQHKIRFLQLFINKARMNGVEEQVLFKAVSSLEEKIRNSYSEGLKISGEELVALMILDGCFILILLLIVSRTIELDDDKDPIFTIPWILPAIQSDLLLLENQVPFFLLQTIIEESKICDADALNRMAFSFFNLSIDKPERYWVKHRDLKPKHLLDLIRMTFTRSMGECVTKPSSLIQPSSDSDYASSLILSAKRLRLQGIKFRLRRDTDSILNIKLEKNKLLIPRLRLDGFISSILLNCVAFEQLYAEITNDITSYVVFMSCLLDSEEDVSFLSNDKRIIENYFGDQNEVSQFFKAICKDVVFDIRTSYLRDVFKGVNEYTSKWYNGRFCFR